MTGREETSAQVGHELAAKAEREAAAAQAGREATAQARGKGGRKKTKVLRWRGVLAENDRLSRFAICVVLLVAAVMITFTQLGFVGVTLPDGDTAYVVTLLFVVCLGSLLLGTFMGTTIGLACGTVLLVHSQFLPLDPYELKFVTLTSSVVMLALAGFFSGLLFAFVLRNNPSQGRRIVYIAIVCLVVAGLYSLVFIVNVFIELIVDISIVFGTDVSEDDILEIAKSTAALMGDPAAQVLATALLTALTCVAGDWAARKVQAHQGLFGLRSVFVSWLGVAIALAFMTMAAASFGVTTVGQINDAERLMRSEANYICGQLAQTEARAVAFNEFMDLVGIDLMDVSIEASLRALSILDTDSLLDGYEQGTNSTAIVTLGKIVLMSNDEGYGKYAYIEDCFSDEFMMAVETSVATDQMQRYVRGGSSRAFYEASEGDGEHEQPQIAYLYARKAPLKNVAGEDVTYTVILTQDSDQVFAKRPAVLAWSLLSAFVVMSVISFVLFFLLDRLVARRIDEENAALELITAGDLDVRAQAGGTREFESLTNGINETVGALKGWIAEAESRMDAELATAKAIQEAALPRTFPPFPDIPMFDVYASMSAARQVGGDFYDFFLIGDDCNAESGKLGFVVADVSGKGVPAALFMMKAKTQIRDYVGSGMELGEAVTEANRQLCDGNNAGMFVTAWVGVLDYGTGHVDYVNAGHNPPLLWDYKNGWQWMRKRSGPMLGLFDISYRAHSVDCMAGDTFLLYSDGVTEAFDVNEKLYGEDRLMQVAEKGYNLHPRSLLMSVRDDVAEHARGAEQSDDITILTLEVGVPPEVTATLEVPAVVEQLDTVNDFLHAELNARLCPKRVQNQLDIVVEELFVNVCRYAYPQATPEDPGTVRIQRTYSAEPPSVTVDIVDSGIPFDPLAKPDAVTPKNIEDVPIGGLGILMTKRLVDEIRYERAGDYNVVTLVKRW